MDIKMDKIRLGRTNLKVTRTSFGALPIQRVEMAEAVKLLYMAYDAGINFYDTARAYSDSEEKLGNAFSNVRENIIIASKSMAKTGKEVLEQIDTSLTKLKTDYIDILQLHTPKEMPDAEDSESIYGALEKAQQQGKIRFKGLTNHRLAVAKEAVESGLFDTIQFPLSAISSKEDLEIIDICRRKDLGVIAMKALSGGLITNIKAAFAFLRQFDNVVPIWGIQREEELREFIELEANPPELDDAMLEAIEKDRKELGQEFCRGCGYCMPCPAEIPINMAARAHLLLERAPSERFLTAQFQEKMTKIDNCIDCGLCMKKCPYNLNTPELLRKVYKIYKTYL
jgi:aryl-alcohol dehydrogenase-like predicted oxidoreductase